MNIPKELRYTKSHEWVQDKGGNVYRMGLTDYAQDELGDIVFVNLPALGDAVAVGDACADVESVKAVSDIYSPVAGTVSAVNEVLLDEPERINNDCYEAWLVEIGEVSATDELMDAAGYEAFIAEAK